MSLIVICTGFAVTCMCSCSDGLHCMFSLCVAEYGAQHAVAEPEWASWGSWDHRDSPVPGAGAGAAMSTGREAALSHLQRLVHGPALAPDIDYLKMPWHNIKPTSHNPYLQKQLSPMPLHKASDGITLNAKYDKCVGIYPGGFRTARQWPAQLLFLAHAISYLHTIMLPTFLF